MATPYRFDPGPRHHIQLCGSGGMADALASGASGGNPVEVQVLSAAPITFESFICGRGGIGRHAALRGQCSQGV